MVRPSSQLEDLLVTYCQRQVGIAPDFQVKFEEVIFAGIPIRVGLAQVLKVRAGARGRIDAVSWANPASPPYEMEPAARMIIGLLATNELTIPAPRVEVSESLTHNVTV
jgi:hypothetical protein